MTSPSLPLSYVSLFSSAGLGCYGFKLEGFKCVATAELIQRRIAVQKANDVCDSEAAYVQGDMTDSAVRDRILTRISDYKSAAPRTELTAVIATPPCQGMSVANHKKKNELPRNSLVVDSLEIVHLTSPMFFILENVRSFLTTKCLDTDGKYKTISQAIDDKLKSSYNVLKRVVNLKDFGSPSSRTRTLVIGVRRDLTGITPLDIFPDSKQAATLRELIGHLPRLTQMGERWNEDPLHAFRSYDERMRPWIQDLLPGQSAFDHVDVALRPHRIIAGKRVENKSKNGDKYRRNLWDKVPPCVHTRNDILASQSTVHPEDDRVFSIRELMLMMGVPNEFKWFEGQENSEKLLQQNEVNIRQCLGEGVPTPVFQSIARKISSTIEHDTNYARVSKGHKQSLSKRIRQLELENPRRTETSAYYTRQDIAFDMVWHMPDFASKKSLRILEPAAGVGAFLPSLVKRYPNKVVHIDIIDIDENTLAACQDLVESIDVPDNVNLRFVCADYFQYSAPYKYDCIVGNPPFGASGSSVPGFSSVQDSKNLFTHFLEKSLLISSAVSFVIPKSFTSAPSHRKLRDHISQLAVKHISDYGEEAFSDIKIETIGLHIETAQKPDTTTFLSYPLQQSRSTKQSYIFDPEFPSWLLYRNDYFDSVSEKLHLGAFSSYRDRGITKAHRKPSGDRKLLRARNIGHGNILESPDDSFVDDVHVPAAGLNLSLRNDLLAAPNLSYYPRAARVPSGYVVDGSAAILRPVSSDLDLDLAVRFFSTKEFFLFYRIARNYSTRSLNIDSGSVYYWGIPQDEASFSYKVFQARPSDLFRTGIR